MKPHCWRVRKTTGVLLTIVGIGLAIVGWNRWHFRRTAGPRAEAAAPTAATGNGRPNPFLADGAVDVGWPFLRGFNFDGHSAEIHLADAWPSTGPPVLWTRPLGQGYSAFTAADDRIFTQYQTLSGQYVVCLSAETGETVWEYRYDWPYEAGGVYPGPRATPTLDGRRIYFAGPSGLVG